MDGQLSIPDVLIVDDDPGVRDALVQGLSLEGFTVHEVGTGEAALDALDRASPDVLLLDVGLPGMSGVDVVHELRRTGRALPVCILSARDDVDDRVEGLAAGADDYVVKPFSIGELAARLHALVRLHRARFDRPLRVGDLTVDFERRTVRRGTRDIGVTTREFELAASFARHPNQILSRDQLLEQVWGYTWEVDSNVVDVFVGYLRKKLEADGEPRIIHTVRGVGFVLRT
ncbi:response regulator transcription factor [Microbacterium sp. No. 7]|uniref:response regulator transcription factor n=1 Tax=Microbacterium sp. No. 7 TaxID=1714373 RepID=UPI0006D279CB|nr:response regulator transcription factor [Microbacterium sp. No. 7]ALJ22175.1 transcriptional regulator [Microbacterium sp. No. 7]